MNGHPTKFNSISELHKAMGQSQPLHPLISLLNYGEAIFDPADFEHGIILNFYKISFKTVFSGRLRYGQGHYDFEAGGMSFVAPGQLLRMQDEEADYDGLSLNIHPDFLRPYALGKSIKQYGFFSYSAAEALYLSDKEKATVMGIFRLIQEELNERIDQFSQDVMVSQIESLLHYCNRFYQRQFITRKANNHDLLAKLETLLDDYFNDEQALMKGLPTVQYLANALHISPRYLSDMLRSLTGQNAQQLIHDKLIEKAKQSLIADRLTVAEVAYRLGFEHPQSFSKLFKNKTNLSPLAFRQSFHTN